MGWQEAHCHGIVRLRKLAGILMQKGKELHCSRTPVSHQTLQREDGDVDLDDRFLSLYSQKSRTNNWTLRTILHLRPDLREWRALIQSWRELGLQNKNSMQYLELKVSVAEALIAQKMEKVDPTESEDDNVPPRKKVKVLPCEAARKMTFIFHRRMTPPMLRGAATLDATWRRGTGVRSPTSCRRTSCKNEGSFPQYFDRKWRTAALHTIASDLRASPCPIARQCHELHSESDSSMKCGTSWRFWQILWNRWSSYTHALLIMW